MALPVNVFYRTLFGSLLLAAATRSAMADQAVTGSLSPGSTFCFRSELANGSFLAAGSATTANGSPATAEWTIWSAPSPPDAGKVMFQAVSPSFGEAFEGAKEYTRACVHNVSPSVIFFSLSQSTR